MSEIDVLYYYQKKLMENMAKSMEFAMFGKFRNKTVTKYLHIPVPIISKHYEDYDDGDGEFDGYLLSVRWVQTGIPIGKEVNKVLVYKKRTGKKIRFTRYNGLKS